MGEWITPFIPLSKNALWIRVVVYNACKYTVFVIASCIHFQELCFHNDDPQLHTVLNKDDVIIDDISIARDDYIYIYYIYIYHHSMTLSGVWTSPLSVIAFQRNEII